MNKYNSFLNYIGSPNKYLVWGVITIVPTENIGNYVKEANRNYGVITILFFHLLTYIISIGDKLQPTWNVGTNYCTTTRFQIS